ncbi:acetyltransferase (GNAT) family protein [Murinocardiopsis flavida]|uniref:Acetyltransferase (GNAT) family protein n=1 Tax=Murinocardiopsis flavida TaxID=645275 RepID=A0A2P8DJF0_9ACTN|nr:GNAT family N-acetyltransferase [Murinocardiopsis flavida]PSK97324.1 acetyltransferase (GNAT) family protein [Murinocardiopsis flavida]
MGKDDSAQARGASGGRGTDPAPVRAADRADIPRAARALGLAFADDPVFAWLFPDSAIRPEKARRFFCMQLAFDARGLRGVDVAEHEGVVRAAALWVPPGMKNNGPWHALRVLPHVVELFGTRFPVIARGMGPMERAAPKEPHWYLADIGTDPKERGTGLGGALLRHGLRRADSDAMPCYLEASRPENIPLYEHFGFAVVNETTFPEGPTIHGMRREPAAG